MTNSVNLNIFPVIDFPETKYYNIFLEANSLFHYLRGKENAFPIPKGYEDNALNLTLDVSDPNQETYIAAAEQAVSRFGRIDILVNNAGHGRITNFEETCEENIRELFEVNFSV